MQKYSVMIIYGGEGYERKVSQSSVEKFRKIKQSDRLSLTLVYISEDGRWFLSDGEAKEPLMLARGGFVSSGKYQKIDAALPVMHGDRGEDGYIGAILAHFRIRCIGSPYYTAALVRDKAAVKLFAKKLGIDTADFVCFPEGYEPSITELGEVIKALGLPLFVKPRRLGSSIGASRADTLKGLLSAVAAADMPFGGGVIIERLVDCELEAECGFLEHPRGEKFAVGAILCGGREYSYARKYEGEDSVEVVDYYPRQSSEREQIVKWARSLVSSLGIRTMCRVDFFVTKDGEILFNEINLLPGFTEDSLFPRLFFASAAELADWLYYAVAESLISERNW